MAKMNKHPKSIEKRKEIKCIDICKQCRNKAGQAWKWTNVDTQAWNGFSLGKKLHVYVSCPINNMGKRKMAQSYPPPKCKYRPELLMIMEIDENHPTIAFI